MNQHSIGAGPEALRTGSLAAPKGAESAQVKATNAAPESPAFHVLLERLNAQAQELEAQAPAVGDPEGLAGAVDLARASLDDATSLSDRLLEAFREIQQQDQSPETHPRVEGITEKRS